MSYQPVELIWQAQERHRAGDDAEAERLYRRALAGYEEAGQTNQSNALVCMQNLAQLLAERREWEAAVVMHRRAAEGLEIIRGETDPLTVGNLRAWAITLEEKGDIAGAIDLYRKVLERRRKALGPDHSETLRAVKELAQLLPRVDQQDEAERLHWEALKLHKSGGNAEGLDALASKSELAIRLFQERDFDSALPLLESVVEGRMRLLGAQHPETLQALQNLAAAFHAKSDWQRAAELFAAVLSAKEVVLGEGHDDTLLTRDNLIAVLLQAGEHQKAEPHLRKQVAALRSVGGQEQPKSLVAALCNLAGCLWANGERPEAADVIGEALQQSRRLLPPADALALRVADIARNMGVRR